MAVLTVLRWPDARLSAACAPVSGDVAALAADMLETMYAAPGRGLAAPQVGALLRMFVMDVTWKDGQPSPMVCINPVIEAMSDARVTGDEGCLSIPGVTTAIDRAASVTLRWTDLTGAVRRQDLTGFAAVCAQHEYDHLDGIVTFDRLSPDARALALKEYTA